MTNVIAVGDRPEIEGPDRTVVVQSILFENDKNDIVRAVKATANACGMAQRAAELGSWEISLGDCSSAPVFGESDIDDITSFVEAAGGTISYKFFDSNLGSAAGQNQLSSNSSSDLIIVLNPDVVMAPETVLALLAAMTPNVGIVEARQLPIEHPKTYELYTGDTSWASTACVLTSRAVFEAVGGFDAQTFFLYGDDVDYSWRVRLAGFRVVYQPAARVFHDKRLTQTADWPSSAAERYYSAESALMLAHKYSRPELVSSLRARFVDGEEATKKALAEYDKRLAAGTLPAPIDGDRKVAEFKDDLYAEHRF